MPEEKQGVSVQELSDLLEPMIRRVVREELARAFEEQGVTYLSSDSPLYEDLLEIIEEEASGEVQLYTYKDAFSEQV